MFDLLHRLRTETRGSVIPLVATGLVALLGLVALGTDVGLIYVERQRLSGVADLASLAALPLMPDAAAARATAQEYLQRNGVDLNRAEVTVDQATNRVTVRVRNAVPTAFARVFGVNEMATSAEAAAASLSLSGMMGAVPLGVSEANWRLGEQVVLKLSANDGTIAPGNYQALSLGKSGASMYEQNLAQGYPDWLRVGQWIPTETGNMANPTVRAVRSRIDADPTATWETVRRGSPRLVVVPVLKDFVVNSRGEVQIAGFAAFYLHSVYETGSDKGEITGRFMRMIAAGEANGSAPNFGVVSMKLIR